MLIWSIKYIIIYIYTLLFIIYTLQLQLTAHDYNDGKLSSLRVEHW